ncbi:MAG: hypothetical protein HeimC2_32520 [Candidatus Heimdallarchaeota archaeon LC_2]|nr:MAG: hypothetical protein HeimC2_32520 [Candidatus Heimdallarchaeota archaeon LC_2]
MSIARHDIQIIHNEEEGPVDFEMLMSKIEQVLVKHNEVRAFISLCQNIEDRSDPQSKYHDKTIDLVCPKSDCFSSTNIIYEMCHKCI